MKAPTVLVVDDNPTNLQLYRDLLDLGDYGAILLDDGGRALETARECRPALILMDIQLPGRSGIEVADEIFRAMAGEAARILALTASCRRPGLVEQLRESGFIGLLSKPCGMATFLEAVRWGVETPEPAFRVFGD